MPINYQRCFLSPLSNIHVAGKIAEKDVKPKSIESKSISGWAWRPMGNFVGVLPTTTKSFTLNILLKTEIILDIYAKSNFSDLFHTSGQWSKLIEYFERRWFIIIVELFVFHLQIWSANIHLYSLACMYQCIYCIKLGLSQIINKNERIFVSNENKPSWQKCQLINLGVPWIDLYIIIGQ